METRPLASALMAAALICLAPLARAATTEPRAIVREPVAVHAGMGDGTAVVGQLAKDDVVTVDIELDGDDGHWCKVIENGKTAPLGYVRCAVLDRQERPARKWTVVGRTSSERETTRRAEAPPSAPRAPVAAPADAARRAYSEVKVVFYWATWCPYCRQARALLQNLGVSLTEYDIDREPERKAELRARTGRSAIPFIDIEGIEIQGFDEETIRDAVEKRRRSS
jgi:glutaredoxin 3